MQAIKNALHSGSSKHDETTTRSNEYQSGSNNNVLGSTTGDSERSTVVAPDAHSTGHTTGAVRDHNSGSHNTGSGLTGNHSGSGLTSGSTPTNSSATHSTGLTGASHSSHDNVGAGRSTAGTSHLDHTTGHDHSIASKFDPTGQNVTHDHKHLNHVVHRDVKHTEIEEVERQREVDRHVHHVQHHVQPVIDRQVKDEVLHENIVPVTKINEKHTSTSEDRSLFAGLASQHKDTETHRGKERTVVDLGEKVHENVHHHVHHVTQPVVEQEVVDRHRIHTVIPVHHTTHEAPIIHKSSTHEPVTMDAFVQGGGKLGSGITHQNADVLNTGNCDRTVEGVGEKLVHDLHLGDSKFGSSGSNYGSTGTSGVTGSHNTGSHSTGTHSTGTHSNKDHVSKDGDHHKSGIAAKVDDLTPSNNRVGSTNM